MNRAMSSPCPNCRLLELKSKKSPYFNLKVGHFLLHFFCSFRKVKILWTEILCNSNTNLKYDLINYRLVNVKGASCHPDGTCIL